MKISLNAINSVYGEYIANNLRQSGRSHQETSIAQHHFEQICFSLIMDEYCGNKNFVSQSNSHYCNIPQNPSILPLNNSLYSHQNAAVKRRPCHPLLVLGTAIVNFLNDTDKGP
jgi:hypothetical protein